ncbi:MAG: hypothetical protein ACRBN8_34370 [Nannocystales bacterium]
MIPFELPCRADCSPVVVASPPGTFPEILGAGHSKPELRSRVRKGLLKAAQLHALSRDVFYGRRGRIKPRELWEQMNS